MKIKTHANRAIYGKGTVKPQPIQRQLTDDYIMEEYTKEINTQTGNGLGEAWQNLMNRFGSQFGNEHWRPTPDGNGTRYQGRFEHHFPLCNFLGPGTFYHLRLNHEPTNFADSIAKVHDKDYSEISDGIRKKTLNKQQVQKLVREADDKLLDSISKTTEYNASALLRNFVTAKIIGGKELLEDLNLLEPDSFVKPKGEIEVPKEQPPMQEEQVEKIIGNGGIDLHQSIIPLPIKTKTKQEWKCCS